MSASAFRARSVLCVALGILATTRVEAQELGGHRIGLTQPASQVVDREAAIEQVRAPHRSYWREGGAITALAAVIIHNALVDNLDESYESTSFGRRVTGSIVAAAIGFLPGALIGGLIPKK